MSLKICSIFLLLIPFLCFGASSQAPSKLLKGKGEFTQFYNFIKKDFDSLSTASFDSAGELILKTEPIGIEYIDLGKANGALVFRIFTLNDSTIIHCGALLLNQPHGRFASLRGKDTTEVCQFVFGNKEGSERLIVSKDIITENHYSQGLLTGTSKKYSKDSGVIIELSTYRNGQKH